MELTTKTKPIKTIARVVSKKVDEVITAVRCDGAYTDVVGSTLDKLNTANNMLKDLNTCMVSLESAGYSDLWMDTVNVDGNFMNIINITPADLIGSDAHKKDVCMQGLGDTLQEWAMSIWRFICAAYTRIIDFLKRVGWLDGEKTRRESEAWWTNMETNLFRYAGVVPAGRFTCEVPDIATMSVRADFMSEVVTHVTSFLSNYLSGTNDLNQALSNFVNIKYVNIKLFVTLEQNSTSLMRFDMPPTVQFDVATLVGQNSNAATLQQIRSLNEKLVKLANIGDTTLRLCENALKFAKKEEAKFGKKNQVITSDILAATDRAQRILNLINVIVRECKIERDYVTVIQNTGIACAEWCRKQS